MQPVSLYLGNHLLKNGFNKNCYYQYLSLHMPWQKCQLFVVQKFWQEIQSGLEAIEVFLEVTIYFLHTVEYNF